MCIIQKMKMDVAREDNVKKYRGKVAIIHCISSLVTKRYSRLLR